MFQKKTKAQGAELDAQFDAFLKASVSSDESSHDTARVSKYLQNNKKREPQPWWVNGDDDSGSDGAVGLSKTGKSFLKKKPDPAKEKPSETRPLNNHKKQPTLLNTMTTSGFDVDISRDSLDDTSLRGRDSTEFHHNGPSVPALALESSNSFTETSTAHKTHPGLETLQEMAEKEQFFENLQKNSGDSTIDYSRLNRDLDKSATLQGTLSSEMGRGELNPERRESDEGEEDDDYHPRPPAHIDLNESGDPKPSMLSKVALMDSLDSTLGTKYASQETRPDDMKAIPEGMEHYDECDGHEEQSGGQNGAGRSQLGESRGDRSVSNHTEKGLTLKTGTGGFGYTDTSHEIEALQAALRQVGMSTMGSTRDLTLHATSSIFMGTGATPVGESRTNTGGATADGPTTADGAVTDSAFGLKAMVANSGEDNRTVDDIIHEVEELQKTGEDVGRPGVRFTEDQDEDVHHGFDLSPVHTQSQYHGFDLSPIHTGAYMNEPEGTDISPLDKYSASHPLSGHELSSSPIPIPAPRSLRPVPKNNTAKEKFLHVYSSGYGKISSPPRKQSKESRLRTGPKGTKGKDAWSPAKTAKQKVTGTELLRMEAGKVRSAARDPMEKQLVASVQSFANYIQTHFTESQELGGNNLKPEFTQDDDSLSTSQKIPVLERERVLIKEVKEWQDLWKEEQRMHAKYKAELENSHRDYERKLNVARFSHEEEVFKLKQENFLLSAKVAQDDDSPDNTRRRAVLDDAGMDGTREVTKEQVALLEKEVREQEGLLAGYQAENERLYQELKKMQKVTKMTEQQMFKENLRLATEVSNLRQQLEQRELESRYHGMITSPAVQQQIAVGNIPSAALGAGRIAMLEAELKQAKSRDESHRLEMLALSHAKKEVERQVERLVEQLKELEQKVQHAQASQSQEAKDVEARYIEETDKLTYRLKWYAENQELLDRDHKLLKTKDGEIKGLQAKIEHLTSEHGRRQAEATARIKERATDARKITDLQRQVREMESIIRKRHPNSLPVLMWAANAAVDNQTVAAGLSESQKPLSVKYLEERCQKLEQEVDEKDAEAKKSLRVVEQKYTSIKYQYEDRIKTLEMKLAKHERPGDGEHPHSHTVALQRELDGVRDRYKKQVSELEAEIERLCKEITAQKAKEQSASKADLRAARDSEQELQCRLRGLERQLLEKEKERASLAVTLERVQKEKQQLNTELARRTSRPPPIRGSSTERTQRPSSGSRPRTGLAKKGRLQDSIGSRRSRSRDSILTVESEPLPAYPAMGTGCTDKEYEPGSFTGVHIEDVLREKDTLRNEVERLKLEVDHCRLNNQKLQAEAEGRERCSSEQSDQHLSALRQSHQMEIQKLLTEHAMANSTSRVAELQGRVDMQEVMIKHLKEQLGESKADSEEVAALRVRTTTLEEQVTELLGELNDARKLHTPEMRHYVALQDQIKKLESRHRQREHELKQIIHQAQSMAAADMELEVAKWKKIVDGKNREIEKFRIELDTILQVLQELQRQGVVLPTRGTSSTSSRCTDR